MKHVVMYSGGVGSWATARRVVDEYGADDLTLLFADVIIEDPDLYRFLIETAGNIFGVEVSDLAARCADIPPLTEIDARKVFLAILRVDATTRIPGLAWIADGRTPWDVFEAERFIGNHRANICSRILKQKQCRDWMNANTVPGATVVHVGIDWTETHRVPAIVNAWKPYRVRALMCKPPLLTKDDMRVALTAVGISPPSLYNLGFAHNNCSGACVKAGIAQWMHLLKVQPDVYRWSEAQEEHMRSFLGKDIAILRDRSSAAKCKPCRGAGFIKGKPCEDCGGTGKATRPLTLRELRENRPQQIDLFDWGGCGCFLGDEAAASEDVPAD